MADQSDPPQKITLAELLMQRQRETLRPLREILDQQRDFSRELMSRIAEASMVDAPAPVSAATTLTPEPQKPAVADLHADRLAKLARLQRKGFKLAPWYRHLKIDKSDYYRWKHGKASPGIRKRLDDVVDGLAE